MISRTVDRNRTQLPELQELPVLTLFVRQFWRFFEVYFETIN